MRAFEVKLPVAAALAAVALASGCGGADATFSTAALDSIEQGQSADSVEEELGAPAAVEDIGQGAELWIYCDGTTPHYLAMTDGEVSIRSLQPPDELRVEEQACR